MENFMNVVKASAMLVCVLFTITSIVLGVIDITRRENKEKKASLRKQQIEVGKPIIDRFGLIQKQLDQIVICMKSVQSRTDKNAAEFEKMRKSTNINSDQYIGNLKLIANDLNTIFEKLDNKATDGIYISRNVLWELIRVLMADNAQEATKIIEEKIFVNMTPEDIPDDIKEIASEAKPADGEDFM